MYLSCLYVQKEEFKQCISGIAIGEVKVYVHVWEVPFAARE